GLSFQRSPVCACSLVSSLLLSGATMSQQSSLTQSAHSVRQVLTAYINSVPFKGEEESEGEGSALSFSFLASLGSPLGFFFLSKILSLSILLWVAPAHPSPGSSNAPRCADAPLSSWRGCGSAPLSWNLISHSLGLVFFVLGSTSPQPVRRISPFR